MTPPPPPPLLELEDISRRFGGLLALNRVSVRVEEGEILGLIGPNGAGKTTLFNVISGLTSPSGGRCLWRGVPTTGLGASGLNRLGIAYRKDLVKGPVTSWMDMFRPAEALRGRIIMIYDARDTIGMALRSLGHSVNSSDPEQLAEAERLLEHQKPYVRSYSYTALTEDSGIVTGEFWMTMIYNGDAFTLKEHNENIEYVVPVEGTNLWTDYLVIFEKSKNKKLAHEFLNYINEPKIAAKIAQHSYYATPNLAARKFLPKDFIEDPAIYPPPEVIARSETYTILPPATTKARNATFARLSR